MAAFSEDLEEYASGPHGKVLLTKPVAKVVEGAQAKQKAQLTTYAGRLVAVGQNKMIDTQFKLEGRFAVGGNKGERAIYAFKPWKLRVYGGFVERDGCRAFIATVAVEKKRDKANRDDLERAAQRLGEYL